MRTMPAFRTGRRVYHDSGSGSENKCVSYCVAALVLAVVLIAIPAFVVTTELAARNMQEAFAEVKGDIVELEVASEGSITHFQSDVIDANVSDSVFGVALQGALQIRRNTEYCQWEESSVTKRDADNRTYTEYYYVKRWRSHRINSAMFDQPAAHHNPHRDPFPSEIFPASSANVGVKGTGMAVLGQDVVARSHGPWRSVDWTLGALPRQSWLSSWWPWPDTTRYESISQLAGAESSHAARTHNFVYVGQGGYFFSPYISTRSESMMKYFFQYLEGSLFDWQLGDLMPSCTAGDIRVSYSVQDPSQISVVGKFVRTEIAKPSWRFWRSQPSGSTVHHIGLYSTPKGHEVGLLHAGFHSAEHMMNDEIRRQQLWCMLARLLLVVPAGALALGASEGFEVEFKPALVGTWGLGLGTVWAAVWSAKQPSTLAVLVLSGAVVGYAWKHGRGQQPKESTDKGK